MQNEQLNNFIINAAKEKTLRDYLSGNVEKLLTKSFKEPATFDFIINGCCRGGYLYDDIYLFIIKDFEAGDNEAFGFADALKASFEQEVELLKQFFHDALTSMFDGIDREGVASAMNNLSNYASSESDYFKDGEGSDHDNSAEISAAIGVVAEVISSLESDFSDEKTRLKTSLALKM